MTIIFGITVVLFVVACLFLVLLVLVQNDKGGGISGAIGGGLASANSVIGAQDTANILSRMTTGFAIGYMVLCIILSLFLTRFATKTGVSESVLKKRAETEAFAPASVLQGGGGLPIAEESVTEETSAAPALPTEPANKDAAAPAAE